MEHKIFVIHVVALNINLGDEVCFSKKAQMAYLKVDEVPIKVLSKYADFINLFLSKLAAELLEYIKINNHAIKFVDNQPLF